MCLPKPAAGARDAPAPLRQSAAADGGDVLVELTAANIGALLGPRAENERLLKLIAAATGHEGTWG